VHFTGSPRGFVVVVAWTPHPKNDQLSDWRRHARAKSGSDSTYQQISIRRVSYRGYDAADWEFSNIYQGSPTRVIDGGFIVRPGRLAYAIELYGPAAEWPAIYARMWHDLIRTFEIANEPPTGERPPVAAQPRTWNAATKLLIGARFVLLRERTGAWPQAIRS